LIFSQSLVELSAGNVASSGINILINKKLFQDKKKIKISNKYPSTSKITRKIKNPTVHFNAAHIFYIKNQLFKIKFFFLFSHTLDVG